MATVRCRSPVSSAAGSKKRVKTADMKSHNNRTEHLSRSAEAYQEPDEEEWDAVLKSLNYSDGTFSVFESARVDETSSSGGVWLKMSSKTTSGSRMAKRAASEQHCDSTTEAVNSNQFPARSWLPVASFMACKPCKRIIADTVEHTHQHLRARKAYFPQESAVFQFQFLKLYECNQSEAIAAQQAEQSRKEWAEIMENLNFDDGSGRAVERNANAGSRAANVLPKPAETLVGAAGTASSHTGGHSANGDIAVVALSDNLISFSEPASIDSANESACINDVSDVSGGCASAESDSVGELIPVQQPVEDSPFALCPALNTEGQLVAGEASSPSIDDVQDSTIGTPAPKVVKHAEVVIGVSTLQTLFCTVCEIAVVRGEAAEHTIRHAIGLINCSANSSLQYRERLQIVADRCKRKSWKLRAKFQPLFCKLFEPNTPLSNASATQAGDISSSQADSASNADPDTCCDDSALIENSQTTDNTDEQNVHADSSAIPSDGLFGTAASIASCESAMETSNTDDSLAESIGESTISGSMANASSIGVSLNAACDIPAIAEQIECASEFSGPSGDWRLALRPSVNADGHSVASETSPLQDFYSCSGFTSADPIDSSSDGRGHTADASFSVNAGELNCVNEQSVEQRLVALPSPPLDSFVAPSAIAGTSSGEEGVVSSSVARPDIIASGCSASSSTITSNADSSLPDGAQGEAKVCAECETLESDTSLHVWAHVLRRKWHKTNPPPISKFQAEQLGVLKSMNSKPALKVVFSADFLKFQQICFGAAAASPESSSTETGTSALPTPETASTDAVASSTESASIETSNSALAAPESIIEPVATSRAIVEFCSIEDLAASLTAPGSGIGTGIAAEISPDSGIVAGQDSLVSPDTADNSEQSRINLDAQRYMAAEAPVFDASPNEDVADRNDSTGNLASADALPENESTEPSTGPRRDSLSTDCAAGPRSEIVSALRTIASNDFASLPSGSGGMTAGAQMRVSPCVDNGEHEQHSRQEPVSEVMDSTANAVEIEEDSSLRSATAAAVQLSEEQLHGKAKKRRTLNSSAEHASDSTLMVACSAAANLIMRRGIDATTDQFSECVRDWTPIPFGSSFINSEPEGEPEEQLAPINEEDEGIQSCSGHYAGVNATPKLASAHSLRNGAKANGTLVNGSHAKRRRLYADNSAGSIASETSGRSRSQTAKGTGQGVLQSAMSGASGSVSQPPPIFLPIVGDRFDGSTTGDSEIQTAATGSAEPNSSHLQPIIEKYLASGKGKAVRKLKRLKGRTAKRRWPKRQPLTPVYYDFCRRWKLEIKQVDTGVSSLISSPESILPVSNPHTLRLYCESVRLGSYLATAEVVEMSQRGLRMSLRAPAQSGPILEDSSLLVDGVVDVEIPRSDLEAISYSFWQERHVMFLRLNSFGVTALRCLTRVPSLCFNASDEAAPELKLVTLTLTKELPPDDLAALLGLCQTFSDKAKFYDGKTFRASSMSYTDATTILTKLMPANSESPPQPVAETAVITNNNSQSGVVLDGESDALPISVSREIPVKDNLPADPSDRDASMTAMAGPSSVRHAVENKRRRRGKAGSEQAGSEDSLSKRLRSHDKNQRGAVTECTRTSRTPRSHAMTSSSGASAFEIPCDTTSGEAALQEQTDEPSSTAAGAATVAKNRKKFRSNTASSGMFSIELAMQGVYVDDAPNQRVNLKRKPSPEPGCSKASRVLDNANDVAAGAGGPPPESVPSLPKGSAAEAARSHRKRNAAAAKRASRASVVLDAGCHRGLARLIAPTPVSDRRGDDDVVAVDVPLAKTTRNYASRATGAAKRGVSRISLVVDAVCESVLLANADEPLPLEPLADVNPNVSDAAASSGRAVNRKRKAASCETKAKKAKPVPKTAAEPASSASIAEVVEFVFTTAIGSIGKGKRQAAALRKRPASPKVDKRCRLCETSQRRSEAAYAKHCALYSHGLQANKRQVCSQCKENGKSLTVPKSYSMIGLRQHKAKAHSAEAAKPKSKKQVKKTAVPDLETSKGLSRKITPEPCIGR